MTGLTMGASAPIRYNAIVTFDPRHARTRAHVVMATVAIAAFAAGCHRASSSEAALDAAREAAPPLAARTPDAGPSWMHARRLDNRAAYIPPQCFTITSAPGQRTARNPCYVCHTQSESPNFADDADLQRELSLPVAAAHNPWTNFFDPPIGRAPKTSDDDVLAYVRHSNYFDDDGPIALARTLAALPPEWDGDSDGRWGGFIPDVWFRFDDRGFDHRPDGTPTGWRAFAYYPFPGTFFPTNGSADDVLVRLAPAFQQNAEGQQDLRVYAINLAIAEALATGAAASIDPADERALGVDLDLDGKLSAAATRVAFDASPKHDGRTRMHYVGLAGVLQDRGQLAIAPGLLPLGTEFFHSVRYLDVDPDGTVRMAPRMKELRYAKKIDWLPYERLRTLAHDDALEQEQSTDGARELVWARERGIYNGVGWVLQGFVEAADGSLRPQSFDETAYCMGCHGGIGATTDSTFAFARKVAAASPANGWYHWSQRDLRSLPEPKRTDGTYEYTTYLRQVGAGDEYADNAEVVARFFDDAGALRPAAIARLHDDISVLLLPSAARALDLDRAYAAIVREQSFVHGRDALLGPSRHVYESPPRGSPTGITRSFEARKLTR